MRLSFTVPYTKYEVTVLAEEGRTMGLAYDPLSTNPPTTWTSRCRECSEGSRRTSLKVRRAVRCLSTLEPRTSGGYYVKVSTGRKTSHTISASLRAGAWTLTVRNRGKKIVPLVLTGSGGSHNILRGQPRLYRAPVLLRTLRMLLTAREPSVREVESVLRGLVDLDHKRHSHDVELLTLAAKVLAPEKPAPGTP